MEYFKSNLRDAIRYQAEEWSGKRYLRIRLFGFALLFCLLWTGVWLTVDL